MTTAAEATSLGRQARNEGDLSKALEGYTAASILYRDQNDPLAYAHTIRHIADIHIQESKQPSSLQTAKPLYEEALEIYRSNLNTKLLDLANTVRPYALLLEYEGDMAQAQTMWQEARNLYASLRLEAGVTECNHHLAELQQPGTNH